MDSDSIEEKAKKWVKENKRVLIEKFASLSQFPGVSNPFTIFMAGSPGAGKTEFSKSWIKEYDPRTKIVRIDADEIRDMIPGYIGGNAYKFQGATTLGVEKLFDYVQDHGQNVIVDGTFSNFYKSRQDVERAINKGRKVGIVYIYQDPKIAWEFTKKREKVEGRRVSRKMFIESFLFAKDNVNKIKSIFRDKIELHLIEKNYINELENAKFNIDMVSRM
ncbi:MAG: zeta toxin family protein [bacterium]|nr:zeta toxin family protein [bacterium]